MELNEMDLDLTQPLVSICCITHNHVNYIEEAIESLLMQKTIFPFEIIINDDASTDGTTEILKEYQQKYPGLIYPIYHDENEYPKGLEGLIMRNIFPRIRGKYAAVCEGDDCWIDPLRLQKQVDFLEKNPDYGLVHADCNFFYENTGKWEYNANNKLIDLNKDYEKEELFKKLINATYIIRTATVLLRSELLNKKEPEEFQFLMADTPLWLTLSQITRFKYIDEVFSVYTIRPESASRSRDKRKQLRFQLSMLEVRIYYSLKCGYPLSDPLTKKYNEALIKYLLYVPGYGYIYPPINPNAYQRFVFNQIKKKSFLWLLKMIDLTASLFEKATRKVILIDRKIRS
jgi:glycosyltransferase involved in cell wall biosynthesis